MACELECVKSMGEEFSIKQNKTKKKKKKKKEEKETLYHQEKPANNRVRRTSRVSVSVQSPRAEFSSEQFGRDSDGEPSPGSATSSLLSPGTLQHLGAAGASLEKLKCDL